MKRKMFKFVVLLVVVLLLVNSVPLMGIANGEQPELETESQNSLSDDLLIREPKPNESTQITEIVYHREENVKHFLLPDGTFQAVVYGEAVHRKDANGNWKNIQNNLTVKEVKGVQHYTTADERAVFAQAFSANSQIFALNENGYSVSMALVSNSLGLSTNVEKNVPIVTNSEERAEQTTWTSIHDAATVNTRSSILYQNVTDNTNLEYVLSGNNIKENIIVTASRSNYNYQFKLELSGLYPVLNKEGSVSLCDTQSGKQIYNIPAPYMYDSNQVYSSEVSYTLKAAGEKNMWYLTVSASSDWINSPDRVFPVIIDPTITTLSNLGDDTFITSSEPGITPYFEDYLMVGIGYVSYISPPVFVLPQGVTITNASLNVTYSSSSANNLVVGAYLLSDTWMIQSLTWDNMSTKPNYGLESTCLSTQTFSATSSAPATASFDITSAMVAHYEGSYYLHAIGLLRQSGSGYASIRSFEADQNYPYLQVTYTDPQIPTGVYKLKNAETDMYMDIYNNGTTAGTRAIQWYTTSDQFMNHLFKITYLNTVDGVHYFNIRSMTNNGMGLYAPLSGANRNVTIQSLTTVDDFSATSAEQCWAIQLLPDSYYTLKNGSATTGGYLSAPNSSENGLDLIASSTKSYYSEWILEPYTGESIDDITIKSYTTLMDAGDTVTYSAVMRSSTIGRNGPVTYLVANTDSTPTTIATINSNTGVMTAHRMGTVKVSFTYANAPWYWVCIVEIKLANGTYYFRNEQLDLFMQIDDADASNNYATSGEIFELHTFDAGGYQRWNVAHVSNGYYKITSKRSGMAVSVQASHLNDNSKALVQETYTGADRQLWKISQKESGTYVLRPKSAEAYDTDWCMAAGLGLNQEGRNVEQREYQDNTTYRDEWMLLYQPTYAHVTLPLICYYDNNCALTPDEIEECVLEATAGIMSTFNIKFEIQSINYSNLLDLDITACDPYSVCSNDCGSVVNCGTQHHKGAGRLLGLLSSDTAYVCRFVGYHICFWNDSEHSLPLGVGVVGGRDSAISTTRTAKNTISAIIQHELTHNLGGDHDSCSENGNNCILKNDNYKGYWCPVCEEKIRQFLREA